MSNKIIKNAIMAMAGMGLFAAGEQVQASSIEGETVNGYFDSALTVGFGKRLKGQNADLAGTSANGLLNALQSGNDGDLNYNKGDFFAAYIKGSHELLLKFPDQWKFFGRASWLYDFKADKTERTALESDARNLVARDVRLLDFWVSKEFQIGEQGARARLGNQVISWGESMFIPGGVNQTNALNLQRLTQPGVPLKEVVLPAPMLSLASGLGHGLNVEAYYQFGWNRNLFPPSGTYFSTADYLGAGKGPIWFANDPTSAGLTNAQAAAAGYDTSAGIGGGVGIPFTADKKPKSSSQYGLALHYKPDGMAVDLGAYYMQYHEKNPFLKYIPNTRNASGLDAQWEFPESRRLFGLSANAQIAGWALGAELSYRPNDGILVDPFGCSELGGAKDCGGNLSTMREAKRYQLHLTGWKMVNPGEGSGALVRALGAQGSNVMWEVVGVKYPGVNNSMYNGLPTYANLSTDLNNAAKTHFGDSFSYGAVVYADLTYDGSLIPGWQVIPNIALSAAIKGDTPNMNFTWLEGMKSVALGVNFLQNPTTWQVSTVYAHYFGGNPTWVRGPYKDRDWFGATLTYNF